MVPFSWRLRELMTPVLSRALRQSDASLRLLRKFICTEKTCTGATMAFIVSSDRGC